MSQHKAFEYIHGDWGSCPADILFMVFRKLDVKSLFNCMSVNMFWHSGVEFYCEHVNLWINMIQEGVDNSLVFSEKSKLDWRDQCMSAQRWLRAKEHNVTLQHWYTSDNSVQNIWVYKDKMIVVSNNIVQYSNIDKFEVIKTVNNFCKSCVKYEETSTMIVEVTMNTMSTAANFFLKLVLTSKLYTNSEGTGHMKSLSIEDINLYKVHLDSCYAYSEKILWLIKATEVGWNTVPVAKYYGTHRVCKIHTFQKNVYVLLHNGDILFVDNERMMFVKVFKFNIPQHLLNVQAYMFHVSSVVLGAKALIDHKLMLHGYSSNNEHALECTGMALNGLTCVLEHGPVLLAGYEKGKIEIFLITKLVKLSSVMPEPELTLNLQEYLDKTNEFDSNLDITSLSVYEDNEGHHLFVSTFHNIFEILLQ